MTEIDIHSETARDLSIASRIRGAIWGRLVADAAALGSHWIYDLDEQRRQFPDGVYGFEAPCVGHYHEGKSPGEQTHYGDGALLLLDVVARTGGFDVSVFGQAFVQYFRPDAYAGYIDHATRETLANHDAFIASQASVVFDFQHGADDDQPATVTRSSVVVARYVRDSNVLDRVEALTRFSQDNARAIVFTRADALLLLRLLAGDTVDDALAVVENRLAGESTAESEAVVTALRRAGADRDRDTTEATLAYGQSCPLPNTFPAAVQILLHHPDNYVDAVQAALRGGGDNAGRAALVGGWVGAHLGVEAIPPKWRERLAAADRVERDVETIVADALSESR